MVVVVIIAALAVLAVPAMAQQLRNRWTQQAAQEVAVLYRNARAQTLGRGGAVDFRFDSTGRGSVQVFEAIRGGNDNCANLPISSCILPNWNQPTQRRLVTSLDPTTNRHYTDVVLQAAAPPTSGQQGQAAAPTELDVCFTPTGRAFWRTSYTGTFAPLTVVLTINVLQSSGGTAYGLTRPVLLLPNGTARMGVAQ
jgi:type II secretory pathway pseudopilin PulG